MKCKRLNVKLIQNVCSAIMHHRLFNIKIYTKLNESKPYYTLNNTEFIKTEYGVKYCIQYRPVWVLERILLRGRWNDKGIWTPDGKFKD